MATAASYGSLSFQQQVDFFEAKNPSVNYATVRGAAHEQSFVSAGAHRADLVADLFAVVRQAIRDGLTLEEFRKDYYAVLDNYGWEPAGGRAWRARVIYRTNLRTSYAAGRYAQLQAVKATRPYWGYHHSDAVEHPRELHLEWDGLIIHADDPWWQSHYPPNGFGCECGVTAYSLDEIHALGKSGPDAPPTGRMRNISFHGQTVQVPEGVDPGWDYAPGRAAFENQVQLTLEKTAPLPAEPAARMNKQLLDEDSVEEALQGSWSNWMDEVAAEPVVQGAARNVGTLSPETVTAMAKAGADAETALVSMEDRHLVPMVQAAQAEPQSSTLSAVLTLAELAQLPQMISQPEAVLLDVATRTLIYVFDSGRAGAKVAMKVNCALQGAARSNTVQSGALVDVEQLGQQVAAGQLVLVEGGL
ncbi:phage minor head protein [Pseudomonas citronellolis]|uniref:phage head morphogenesis protein n=1 Tax=Pseudomonas citronellolis TaxID=53408 RepID=UPI0023E3E3B1|nr:phage minor head protein [Pseudomonas citronellolis]MDF3932944.1 phage minor head protein [Pseudomonas citronellolis]